MKKFLLIFVAAVLALVGCAEKFEDLNDRVDNLEDRVSVLEEHCRQMNTNISSLKVIISALQSNDYITSITPIMEDGKEIGYTITFAKSSPITIYHGTDGKDGQDGKDGADGKDGHTPIIGVRKDVDGIYYWTLDGEWLLDDSGKKIKTEGRDGEDDKDGEDGQPGADGVTPELKIEDGYWYISYDNGQSWRLLGKATGEDGKDGADGRDGDSFFREVRQDDMHVCFVLSDGTELVVPKCAPLSISFNGNDLIVMNPNSTRNIGYTIESSSSYIKVEVMSSADIKAKVVSSGLKAGYIQVMTSDTIDEYSKVVVLVSDGASVIMSTLTFEEETIKVLDVPEVSASYKGGGLTLYYLSNVECEVIIPENAAWIHLVSTKALQEHEIVLSLDPNPGQTRSANVVIRSESGMSLIYIVEQQNYDIQKQLERNALIDLYNATNGDNWTRKGNWCSELPLNKWDGVVTDKKTGLVTQLYLNDNNLQGELPESIGNLHDLEVLFLYRNFLEGEIPESVCNLLKLKRLVLYENKFTGRIPENIGNLQELSEFTLQNNQLEGNIPASIARLAKLDEMDLSDNNLSGNIAAWLMELPIWRKAWAVILYKNEFNTSNLIIPAPRFKNITTIDGSLISDDIYSKNELTVLFSWNTSCVYSAAFTPILHNLYDYYKDRGLEVVSYTSWGKIYSATLESVQEYNRHYGLDWITFNSADESGNDYTLDYYQNPGVFVVNKDGYIVFSSVLDNYRELDKFLAEYFCEDSSSLSVYESKDYSRDHEVVTLQTATKGRGIDIVLMGDGYSDRLIADGTYADAMTLMKNNLFTEEPYKSFKDYFNVYMVNAVSKNEIYTDDSETALGCRFSGASGHITANPDACLEYARGAISDERMDEATIVVMANIEGRSGRCYMYLPETNSDYASGTAIALVTTNYDKNLVGEMIHHEANGHAFAKLLDEYYYYEKGAVTQSVIDSNTINFGYGWGKNVDFTSDLSIIKWNKFINDSRYADEGIGAYEGALTYWSGAWRPSETSIMVGNTGGFNAPSREAIYYRIHKLAYGADWEYDYEDFVEYDVINRASASSEAAARRARQNYVEAPSEPLAPPVFVGKTWREAVEEGK